MKPEHEAMFSLGDRLAESIKRENELIDAVMELYEMVTGNKWPGQYPLKDAMSDCRKAYAKGFLDAAVDRAIREEDLPL